MKKHFPAVLISISLYIVGFLICIYPSFVTSPGVDCIAGCRQGKGFPYAFNYSHRGSIVIQGSAGVPNEIEVSRLLIDYFFVSILASLPILYSFNKKRTSQLRALLYSFFTIVVALLIGFPFLLFFLSTAMKRGATLQDIPFNLVKKPNLCIADVKQCSNGSYVGRSGPKCEFALCPSEDILPVTPAPSYVADPPYDSEEPVLPTPTSVPKKYLPKSTTLNNGLTKITSMFNYSITVPQEWEILNGGQEAPFEFDIRHCLYGAGNCQEQASRISFSLLLPNPEKLPIQEWANKYRSDTTLSKDSAYGIYTKETFSRTDYSVANTKGIFIQPETSAYSILLLPYQGKVLEVHHSYSTAHGSYLKEHRNDLKQIMSTFKY